MAREHRILSALQGATSKVPHILGYCEDVRVTGAPFYLMEFVDGLTLNRLDVAQRLAPSARAVTNRSLVSTLTELPAIDLDQCRLGDLRRSASFIERQLRRWTRHWYAQKTRELPLVEELAERFATAMPEERATVRGHDDYGLHNVLVAIDGEVRAVLDWELSTAGDPLADLGQMIAYWNESDAPARQANAVFVEPVTELEGFLTGPELAAAHAEVSGRDLFDLGFLVAFAYWKTAIIVEGVYSRWLENPSNGVGAERLAPAVPRMAELARDALKMGV